MNRRKVALLRTESKNDWEADRFRRIGTGLLTTAIPEALENLLLFDLGKKR